MLLLLKEQVYAKLTKKTKTKIILKDIKQKSFRWQKKIYFCIINNIIILRLLLIFVLGAFLAQSQQFGYNVFDSLFYVVSHDKIEKRDRGNNIVGQINISLDSTLIQNSKLVFTSQAQYIVSYPDDKVFKSSSNSFSRIDQSRVHNMTQGSDVFVHNDTIFKFGGYGYWSSRNFFTFFDDSTKKWKFYKVNGNSIPRGVHNFISSKDKQSYYFCYGLTPDPMDGETLNPNSNLWRFDFSDRRWTNLGVVKVPEYSAYINQHGNPIHYVLPQKSKQELVTINFSKNAVQYYSGNTSILSNVHPHQGIVIDDTLFIVQSNNIVKEPLAPLLQSRKSGTTMFLDAQSIFNYMFVLALTVLVVSALVGLYLSYIRKRKPHLLEKGIRYNGFLYPLNALEYKIFKEVLMRKRISSELLMTIVEDKKLSFAQNNKLKKDAIDRINSLILTMLSIENLIYAQPIEEDKRKIIYMIKENPIQILKL